MAKGKDITNERFGNLVAISDTGKSVSHGRVWLCKCDCGNTREVCVDYLKRGCVDRCKNCAHVEKVKRGKSTADKFPKKPYSKERLHCIWSGMKTRCKNPHVKDYNRYGGRGISVCKEWDRSYLAFKKWAVKSGYNENMTIERIDNDGDYSPNNCKWITQKEQGYNKETTLYVTFENRKIPFAKIIHDLGLDYRYVLNYFRSYELVNNNTQD